jgi:hypothetical protein
MSYIWLTRILLFAVVLVAARKGGEPERLTAAVLLSTFVLDLVNHAVFGDPVWYAVNPGHVVIDSWAFCALLSIALYANRGWPLLVGAGQMIVMVGHVAAVGSDDGPACVLGAHADAIPVAADGPVDRDRGPHEPGTPDWPVSMLAVGLKASPPPHFQDIPVT